MAVKIKNVEKKSVCYRKGIRGGDSLLSINGNPVHDVLDYRFYASDDVIHLTYENAKGKTKSRKVKTNGDIDSIGLTFDTYLMDRHHSCKNKCIFCFVDQMPEGMRQSLYFKDDDSRLSFLFGNYITLTALSDYEADRIIKMHISPINISVHTMNPLLRVEMMKNPKAGDSLALLKRFADAGIKLNTQLVLCPGINDGDELTFSLRELEALGDSVQSIAAVPVGLTKHRDGLHKIEPYTKESACDVISRIDEFNRKRLQAGKDNLAFAADEFYICAEKDLPDVAYYGEFSQLDNGVGMLTLLQSDFEQAISEQTVASVKLVHVDIATGVAAYPYICKLSRMFMQKYPSVKIHVHQIINHFFGETVTVAGLITANDLIDQLRGKVSEESCLLIPDVMLKSKEEPVFLDDLSVADVADALCVSVVPVGSDGYSLANALFSLMGG